jgi:hypothetical protein
MEDPPPAKDGGALPVFVLFCESEFSELTAFEVAGTASNKTAETTSARAAASIFTFSCCNRSKSSSADASSDRSDFVSIELPHAISSIEVTKT